MAENNIPSLESLAKTAIGAWVQRELAKQTWWQAKSNTVVTAVGTLVTFLWWIIGTGIALPNWALWVIGGIFFVATVLGVNITRNGMTPTLGAKVQNAATDPVVLNTIIQAAEQTAGSVFRGGATAALDDALGRIAELEAALSKPPRHTRGD